MPRKNYLDIFLLIVNIVVTRITKSTQARTSKYESDNELALDEVLEGVVVSERDVLAVVAALEEEFGVGGVTLERVLELEVITAMDDAEFDVVSVVESSEED